MHGLQLSLWVVVVFSYEQNCRCLWLSKYRCYDVPGLHYLGRMTASSSPGFEDFPAPFLKYAYPGDEKDKNVIVPYPANLFHVALSEKRIPACWEKAKISPLYKKGSKLDPNNYRMLAVSGTL